MQRFLAELSNVIDKGMFESSWSSDLAVKPEPKVEFLFAGQRVSVLVHSDLVKWPSANFYRTFSAAIRRLDPLCNVRWL